MDGHDFHVDIVSLLIESFQLVNFKLFVEQKGRNCEMGTVTFSRGRNLHSYMNREISRGVPHRQRLSWSFIFQNSLIASSVLKYLRATGSDKSRE